MTTPAPSSPEPSFPALPPLIDDDALVPLPPSGRTYTGRARARIGDVSPKGRLRLDALARFAQDVSNDDTVDAGLEGDMAWVARRLVVEVHAEAQFREELTMTTFCGGIGSRWAERRVSIAGEHGARIEVATLWVHLDLATSRPIKLPEQFHEIYAEAAQGRVVRARLHHGDPPAPDPDAGAALAPWPLRFCDFDVLEHVNNAVSWEAVEEERATRDHLRAPVRAEVEYREAIERGHEVARLAVDHEDGALSLWLVDADEPTRVHTSARVRPLAE